jgi:hypothetical protein
VLLHLPFKMLYDAPSTWRLLQAMILLLGACYGEKNKDNKKTSEAVKFLQLIGCSYCKTLTLNLLHKLLPILTLLPGGDGNQQFRNRGMKCIGAQQQDLCSCSKKCGAVGGLEQGSTSTTLVTKESWIIVQRWCYAGPSLDHARDVSLDTKEVTKHHLEQKGKTNAMN